MPSYQKGKDLMRNHHLLIIFGLLAFVGLGNLPSLRAAEDVTLYTSVDDPYVRPLVARFEKQTGIKVTLVTDGEATKTAGLVEKIEAEKSHPKADVYWGNEPFHTINLADKDIFAPYRSPIARQIPARRLGNVDLYASIGLSARDIKRKLRSFNGYLEPFKQTSDYYEQLEKQSR